MADGNLPPYTGRKLPRPPKKEPSFTPFVIVAAALVAIWAVLQFALPAPHPTRLQDVIPGHAASP